MTTAYGEQNIMMSSNDDTTTLSFPNEREINVMESFAGDLNIWRTKNQISNDSYNELINICNNKIFEVQQLNNKSHDEGILESLLNEVKSFKDAFLKQYQENLKYQQESVQLLKSLLNKSNVISVPSSLPSTLSSSNQLIGDDNGIKFRFPINSDKELERLNEEIGKDKEKFISKFKKTIYPEGIVKNFGLLFGEHIVVNYNFSGVQGKKCFKELENINDLILEVICFSQPEYDDDDYVEDIKRAFKLGKNRHFKKICIQNKQQLNNESHQEDRKSFARKMLARKIKSDISTKAIKAERINFDESSNNNENDSYDDDSISCNEKDKKSQNFSTSNIDTVSKNNKDTKISNQILLPIETDEEMQILENELAANNTQYVKQIKKTIKMGRGLIKGLSNIFSNKIIVHYNYKGVQGKKSFSVFTHINNILYECVKEYSVDEYTYKNYIIDLKKAMHLAKNRYFKTACLNRRLNRKLFDDETLNSTKINQETWKDNSNGGVLNEDPIFIEEVNIKEDLSAYNDEDEDNDDEDDDFIEFPVTTLKELEKFDQELKRREPYYLDIMRRIIIPGGLNKNISRIFGDQIILDYNYDGVHCKKSFKKFIYINKALYKILKTDDYTLIDYVIDIKKAFKAFKNRHFKGVHLNRKKEQLMLKG